MFLWFVGGAIVIVWFVFTDDRFDYRLLPVGAVAPGWIDLPSGRAGILHSLTVSALLLTVVMVVTRRGTSNRTFWMGLPIGTLLYLTLTGAWRFAAVFFWPFFGLSIPYVENPILARGWWNLPLEVVGALACWWVWTRAGLADPQRRAEFRSTGRLHLPVR